MDGIGQEEVGETFMNKRMTLPRRPWSPACRLRRVQSDPTGPLIEAYAKTTLGTARSTDVRMPTRGSRKEPDYRL